MMVYCNRRDWYFIHCSPTRAAKGTRILRLQVQKREESSF